MQLNHPSRIAVGNLVNGKQNETARRRRAGCITIVTTRLLAPISIAIGGRVAHARSKLLFLQRPQRGNRMVIERNEVAQRLDRPLRRAAFWSLRRPYIRSIVTHVCVRARDSHTRRHRTLCCGVLHTQTHTSRVHLPRARSLLIARFFHTYDKIPNISVLLREQHELQKDALTRSQKRIHPFISSGRCHGSRFTHAWSEIAKIVCFRSVLYSELWVTTSQSVES